MNEPWKCQNSQIYIILNLWNGELRNICASPRYFLYSLSLFFLYRFSIVRRQLSRLSVKEKVLSLKYFIVSVARLGLLYEEEEDISRVDIWWWWWRRNEINRLLKPHKHRANMTTSTPRRSLTADRRRSKTKSQVFYPIEYIYHSTQVYDGSCCFPFISLLLIHSISSHLTNTKKL